MTTRWFAAIPTPDLARRDYVSFSEAQRTFVQRLLVERRLRRFEPSALPSHLAQVAGHTRHARCLRELDAFVDPGARVAHLSLRTLHGGAAEPRYVAGVEPRPGSLVLIDPGLSDAPLEAVALLELDGAPTL